MAYRTYPIDRSQDRPLRVVRRAGDAAEAPPNFNSAADGSAWWLVVTPAQTLRVETNGYGFVWALQAALAGAGEATSYDGHPVSGRQVQVDGIWGPTTMRALWAQMHALGASPGLLAAVQLAGRNRTITFESLAAAVWYLTQVGGATGAPPAPIEQLRLPAATVLPRWLERPPGTPADVRVIPQVTAPVAAADPPPVPAPAAPGVPGQTTPPAAPEPLPPDVSDDLARPAGIEPRRTSNVPWGALLVVAGVGGIAWFVATSMKPARGGRRRR